MAKSTFGAPMRELFLFDPQYKNLNHGSYGTYPRAVQAALRGFQDEAEARTDTFIRYTTPPALDASRTAVAKILNVPRRECVFVKNATTGVNTVLRNLRFSPGDVLLYFDTVYGAVEMGITSLRETTENLLVRKVEYTFPVSHGQLVQQFREVIDAVRRDGLNPRIALFDVIVSVPGVRFPFEALTGVCREEGILSLIDGAHGIGHIPIDLGVLQPDFFTSNCHKWLFTPRGCAVLYVAQRNQHLIRTTLPTSWGFIPETSETGASVPDGENTPFEKLFEFVATTDDTAYMCVPAAVKFREELCGGEDQITSYMESLAREGGDLVAAILGTEVLQETDLQPGEKSQLRRCAMANIRVPVDIEDIPDVPAACAWLQKTLNDEYNTFVPFYPHGGALWFRVCAQVYLEKSDFQWLGEVLKELVAKFKGKKVDLPLR
ncbi:hypothetical protein ASPZODRAFT_64654 [Penicilliopsis zonata CBS 506.65]|uniref:Aminotransferase class V domain-containing protein n=1 Tax=Penicilliopsis zonata CBS 506.65 TaxID=1073090 RepID=A0A1L9SJ15_9EURO|nr:hypothetical protein ASPZODRAFT_64654 [Penicilliopsis zonata CBS 506.65]OJJ47209.1 hypothetical protein ASPZODRAFT_64654 [Penicilliopsis zonata CBS 506.65]